MSHEVYQVLLVDDDEEDYIVTQDLLSEAEQSRFKLAWVSSYQSGLAEIAKDRHHAYLLDYRLGQESGLELLREAIGLGCRKPLILLTGVGDYIIDQTAMDLGAADYLVKGHTLNAPLLERSIHHAIERKRAESQQLQILAELAAANQELKDFAYVVSHDLKAPLRGILSVAEWLERDYGPLLNEDGKEMLQLLSGRARRMSDLIDGVLQYSRVSRSQETKARIELTDLVADVIDSMHPPPSFSIEVETELPALLAEKTRIYQLFQNLIGNAIKYMGRAEGTVWIGFIDNPDGGYFYVRDTGIGINVRHFNKIFQLFQTLTPRDQTESTGVGLAIVKKIVERYGGKIWITSEVGNGSTFSFTLPNAIEGKPA